MAPEEADEQRDRLLSGFRWILVDEYQDIVPEQYELISALAGRTRPDEEGKLSLFAVGDDDQNIYAFDGASVEFIRRFEADYTAKAAFLTENYRSTTNIISAANLMISPALDRMKVANPITIDRARKKAPAGGKWETIDRVAQGRVQILPTGANTLSQAVAVMSELQRLASVTPGWDWAIILGILRAAEPHPIDLCLGIRTVSHGCPHRGSTVHPPTAAEGFLRAVSGPFGFRVGAVL